MERYRFSPSDRTAATLAAFLAGCQAEPTRAAAQRQPGSFEPWLRDAGRPDLAAAALFGALAERARQCGVRRLAASTRYAAAIRLNERLGLASRLPLRRYALGNPGHAC